MKQKANTYRNFLKRQNMILPRTFWRTIFGFHCAFSSAGAVNSTLPGSPGGRVGHALGLEEKPWTRRQPNPNAPPGNPVASQLLSPFLHSNLCKPTEHRPSSLRKQLQHLLLAYGVSVFLVLAPQVLCPPTPNPSTPPPLLSTTLSLCGRSTVSPSQAALPQALAHLRDGAPRFLLWEALHTSLPPGCSGPRARLAMLNAVPV